MVVRHRFRCDLRRRGRRVSSAGVPGLLAGFTDLEPFTADAVGTAPNEPGVHAVWGPEPDDGIIYVGQTRTLRTRLRQHLSGDRQASVLFEQVGELLDRDEPESATREAIQEWLGR